MEGFVALLRGMGAANIYYEIADRTQRAIAGGLGAIHQMVKRLGLDTTHQSAA